MMMNAAAMAMATMTKKADIGRTDHLMV